MILGLQRVGNRYTAVSLGHALQGRGLGVRVRLPRTTSSSSSLV